VKGTARGGYIRLLLPRDSLFVLDIQWCRLVGFEVGVVFLVILLGMWGRKVGECFKVNI
jgi:hypothetical protein